MQDITTIVEMKFGSHLYGTQTPASDLDYKAVHLPTAEQILLGRIPQTITKNTKNGSLTKNTNEDVDHESYSLQRFLKLASEGQTVAMDILFCPPELFLNRPHQVWKEILLNRDKIVTSKAASFIGYCRQQANKYGIKGSRMQTAESLTNLLRDSMDAFGTTSKLGEIRALLELFIHSHEHVELVEIEQNTGGVEGSQNKIWHLNAVNRMCPLTFTIKKAHEIYSGIHKEYGKRAENAKNNSGHDWKALSHAVRVGGECVELLKTGNIIFPRPEAAHLVKIKTGQVPYEQVAEEIEQLLYDAEAASASSTLRPEADREWIDQLVYDVYRERVVYHD